MKFKLIIYTVFFLLIFLPKAGASIVSFYTYDAPGRSITAITNSSGSVVNNYDYDSFGNIKISNVTIQNNFQYVGEQYEPEANLIYLRNRYYDPNTGRFVSKDIIEGAIQKPQTSNPYPYCTNNPVNSIDPSGNDAIEGLLSIGVGAYTGFLSGLTEGGGPSVKGIIAGIVGGSIGAYVGLRIGSYLPTNPSSSTLVGAIGSEIGNTTGNFINGKPLLQNWTYAIGSGAVIGFTQGALASVWAKSIGSLGASFSSSAIGVELDAVSDTLDHTYDPSGTGLNNLVTGSISSAVNYLTSGFNSLVNSLQTNVFGGVDLNLTATLLGNVQDFGGATYDQATGQIILYGQQNTTLPPMDLDDLSVAVDSEYGLNGVAPADPGVSIGTVASTVAGQMYVGYFGAVMSTEFGKVLFNSDRLLKSLSLGEDNITGQPVSVSVPGYIDMLNRYKAGGAAGIAAVQANPMSRMWFTPKQITLAESADGSSMEFSTAVMQLLTSSQLNGIAETDPYSLAFAAEVTQDYNLYAAEFPVLQQLTRLGKITSVVKWIQDNNIPFDLSFFSNYVPQSVPTACPSSNGAITEPSGCTGSQVCTAYACTPQYTPQTSVSTTFGVPGGTDTITITGGVIYTLDASNFATSTDTATTAPSSAAGQAAVNARPSENNFSWNFNAQDFNNPVLPAGISLLQRNMLMRI